MSLADPTTLQTAVPRPEDARPPVGQRPPSAPPPGEPRVVVQEFSADQSARWDDFVDRARNGHFMFTRRYLEYHGDRFEDASLMAVRSGRLIAILPAHRVNDTLISHQGLPFAGWITHPRLRMRWMQEVFEGLLGWMAQRGYRRLVYKSIPHIYHRIPAEEDLYVLAQLGAVRTGLKVTAARQLAGRFRGSSSTRRLVQAAREAGLSVRRWDDLEAFHAMQSRWLAQRHSARPLHTLDQTRWLTARFPESIRVYAACRAGQVLTAQRVYLSETVVRLQGLGQSPEGQRLSAGRFLQAWLDEQPEFRGRWLDFGTSMDPDSGELDHSLFDYKESLGCRAVMLPTFALEPFAQSPEPHETGIRISPQQAPFEK